MGAAALICAAADESPEGQAIEAIAVYGTYGSMRGLVQTIGQRYFLPPLDKLVRWVGIPLASAQVGSDLMEFAPADVVQKLWPRPILIIHGIEDEIIAFENGQALYRAATFPKRRIWVPESDHNSIVSDDALSEAVTEFFDTAHPTPLI